MQPVLHTDYRHIGISKSTLYAMGRLGYNYPGAFRPAIPAIQAIVARDAASIVDGTTVTVWAFNVSGDGTTTFTFWKAGVEPVNAIDIRTATTAEEVALAMAAALEDNVDTAARFDVSFWNSSTLHLLNTYNDTLGFNIAGASGNVTATGSAALASTMFRLGQNFKPGFIFVPFGRGHWAPAIQYPVSLQPPY